MHQGNIKKALDNLDNAGYRLRCAREYMGLSEKEVADELKLMVSHVRAIEQNRSEYLIQRKPFERYLRAYARLVQLNPDTIAAMYFAKSAPDPRQPVDITTRLEIPPPPEATLPNASPLQFARNNYYHPAILGTGFLVIGLSLFAGWGVKQLVDGQQKRPVLAQNSVFEVQASTRRQPFVSETPKLAEIRFEKPVTRVPPAGTDEAAETKVALTEPDPVAAEGRIDRGTETPVSKSARVVAEPAEQQASGEKSTTSGAAAKADQPVLASTDAQKSAAVETAKEKVELKDFKVQVKERPNVKLTAVATPAVSKKPVVKVTAAKKEVAAVASEEVSRKPPVGNVAKASTKTKSVVPLTLSAAPAAVAATTALADSLLLPAPKQTLKTQAPTVKPTKKAPTVKPTKIAKPTKTAPSKNPVANAKPIAVADTRRATDAAPAVTDVTTKPQPELKLATTDSKRKSNRERNRQVDDRNGNQLPRQNRDELSGSRKLGRKSSDEPANIAAPTTKQTQPILASLRPQIVTAQKKIPPASATEPRPAKTSTSELEAGAKAATGVASVAGKLNKPDSAFPLVAGALRSDSENSGIEAGDKIAADLAADLDESAALDAAINDADADVEQKAEPFEAALANSSDSASVARLALLESYKSTLRKRVYEHVTYPGRALSRNQEGRVVMSATVSRAGELLSVEMAQASKYGALNRASEKAIKQSNPFPAAPDTLSGESFVLTVPVVFKVPAR